MSDTEETPASKPVWPWVLWGIASALTVGYAALCPPFLQHLKDVYKQMEMQHLPRFVEWILAAGPYLWIFALANSLVAGLLMRRMDSRAVATWFVVTLIFFGFMVLTVSGAYRPLRQIQENLGHR